MQIYYLTYMRQNKLSEQESICIRYLRALSCCLIVLCHYCQSFGNDWAFILNIGVQFFFLISGFLYGKRIVTDWGKWWKRKLQTFIIPSVLFCLLILIYVSIMYGNVHWWHYIMYSTLTHVVLSDEISQLAHLWFLSAILLCYIITPVLQWLQKWSEIVLAVLVVVSTVEYLFIQYHLFHYSWFFLYSFGYFLANSNKIRLYALISIGVLFPIVWYFDLREYAFEQIPCRVSHDFGAISIFSIIIFSCKIFRKTNIPKWISVLDRYSFYIYLVHGTILIELFMNNILEVNTIFKIIFSAILIVLGVTTYYQLSQACISSLINKKMT